MKPSRAFVIRIALEVTASLILIVVNLYLVGHEHPVMGCAVMLAGFLFTAISSGPSEDGDDR